MQSQHHARQRDQQRQRASAPAPARAALLQTISVKLTACSVCPEGKLKRSSGRAGTDDGLVRHVGPLAHQHVLEPAIDRKPRSRRPRRTAAPPSVPRRPKNSASRRISAYQSTPSPRRLAIRNTLQQTGVPHRAVEAPAGTRAPPGPARRCAACNLAGCDVSRHAARMTAPRRAQRLLQPH